VAKAGMDLIPEPQQEQVRKMLRAVDAKLAVVVVDGAVFPLAVKDVCGGDYLDNQDRIDNLEDDVETLTARIESLERILGQRVSS
jgi:hypothetical protein